MCTSRLTILSYLVVYPSVDLSYPGSREDNENDSIARDCADQIHNFLHVHVGFMSAWKMAYAIIHQGRAKCAMDDEDNPDEYKVS
jgi:hypothetical protein